MVSMLIFAAFVLIESIIVRMLIIRFPDPPLWIQKFSKFIKMNVYLKYFTLSIDSFNVNDKIDEAKEAWTLFSRFVERLCIIFIILCFTLYNGY